MQTKWFSHLKSKEEQEEFKKLVLGSGKVLDRMREICYNVIQNRELPPESYLDEPNWAFRQADRNGYLRAYREIHDLLILSDHEK